MRLNWFSPLPPAKSGIADYTFGILPELSSRAEVTLWTDRAGWDSRLEKYAEVRHYRPDRMDWVNVLYICDSRASLSDRRSAKALPCGSMML